MLIRQPKKCNKKVEIKLHKKQKGNVKTAEISNYLEALLSGFFCGNFLMDNFCEFFLIFGTFFYN
jgi:hypothetical protein